MLVLDLDLTVDFEEADVPTDLFEDDSLTVELLLDELGDPDLLVDRLDDLLVDRLVAPFFCDSLSDDLLLVDLLTTDSLLSLDLLLADSLSFDRDVSLVDMVQD